MAIRFLKGKTPGVARDGFSRPMGRAFHVSRMAVIVGTLVTLILGGCDRQTDFMSAEYTPPEFSDEVQRYISIDAPSFALVGATLFDGSGGDQAFDQTILVHGGKIVAVGNRDTVTIPSGFELIDVAGSTVVPGFVGMHNHMHRPGSHFERYAASRLYLGSGVTTIQTTGSADVEGELALVQSITDGREPGPQIFPTGPYITGPGGNSPPMTIPFSEEEARDLVSEWAELGITWLKLYRHVAPEIAAVIIDEAHIHGLKVTGHLCSLTFREAALMGIDSIEHGLLSMSDLIPSKPRGECVSNADSINQADLNASAMVDLIDLLVDQGVTLTSTLAIMESHFPHRPQGDARSLAVLSPVELESYHARQERLASTAATSRYQPELFDKIRKFEHLFVVAGGRLVAGPDTGRHIVPGFGDQRNFELLVESGFSVTQSIKIMTANGADALGISDSVGLVREGFRADLLVLAGDLGEDPSSIRNVDIVFRDGIGYDPALLLGDVVGRVGLGE